MRTLLIVMWHAGDLRQEVWTLSDVSTSNEQRSATCKAKCSKSAAQLHSQWQGFHRCVVGEQVLALDHCQHGCALWEGAAKDVMLVISESDLQMLSRTFSAVAVVAAFQVQCIADPGVF